MVIFAEFGGAASFLFPEDAIEIAQVIKTATVTDLGDGVGAVHQ